MNLQPINASASPEVQINENFETIEFASVYGKRQPATTGLTWGYYGGRWGGFAVADGTLTLTNASDNYVVVLRSSGAVSTSTVTTNWNNTTAYARVYKITTAGGVVTAVEDHRAGPNGVHGPMGSGVEIKGLTFTSDTDSTADSDPGNGLMKWNNATQSSATVLYFDNQTLDAISLTTLWASLSATGSIYLQQADDPTKWQEWNWTALPVDGTGYRKFTCTLQAYGGAIADAKTVLCDFESAGVAGILGSASGGTGNGFTKFTGPTSSEKTFTLPDVSSTIVTEDATAPGIVRGKTKEIFKTASADSPLTAAECSGTIVSNYGMTDADCTIDLPTAAEGLAFVAILPAVRAHFFKFHCPAAQADKIYLLGVAGSDDGNVGVASGYATGSAASFFTFKASDGGYDWLCIPIFGTWVTS